MWNKLYNCVLCAVQLTWKEWEKKLEMREKRKEEAARKKAITAEEAKLKAAEIEKKSGTVIWQVISEPQVDPKRVPPLILRKATMGTGVQLGDMPLAPAVSAPTAASSPSNGTGADIACMFKVPMGTGKKRAGQGRQLTDIWRANDVEILMAATAEYRAKAVAGGRISVSDVIRLLKQHGPTGLEIVDRFKQEKNGWNKLAFKVRADVNRAKHGKTRAPRLND